jgi:hypothetical protein
VTREVATYWHQRVEVVALGAEDGPRFGKRVREQLPLHSPSFASKAWLVDHTILFVVPNFGLTSKIPSLLEML